MDGESDAGDSRFIDELVQDRSARDTWWRYHLISDILKHDTVTLVHRDLSSRISADIHNEPAILAPKPDSGRNWIRPVAGLAIAASVAVVSILSIQQRDDEITGPPPQITQTVAQQVQQARIAPVTRQFNVPARLASVETLEEIIPSSRVNSRLNSYMLNYNEYRTTETRMQGMLPYVRIIAHENDN